MDNGRTKQYEKNPKLETLLAEINSLLHPVEEQLSSQFQQPQNPVILIVGGPRAGTTLMMQWLAASGAFSYPSNLLSRFYGAPCIGAKIQLLLTSEEYDFKGEFKDFKERISFSSDLGKTQGVLSPNDFWYFWRRFIPNKTPRYLTNEELEQVDGKGLVAEVAAIESVFQKPFAMKAMILEQNIPFLSSLFNKVLFIHIKRHPFFNIQSLLESREKFFGDRRKWYSIKPKEYSWLKNLDPIEQVAGQVYFKNLAIDEGLAKISENRYVTITYDEFCKNPKRLWQELTQKLKTQGCNIPSVYDGPDSFVPADKVRLKDEEVEKIVKAYKKFSGKEIWPENKT